MDFGLSKEISEDVYDKADIITQFSDRLAKFFEKKDYGRGVESISAGIICVHPQFDSFFNVRKKYTKPRRLIECDVKLDHEQFKSASRSEIEGMLLRGVLSLVSRIRELEVPDFDVNQFRRDIEGCCEVMSDSK